MSFIKTYLPFIFLVLFLVLALSLAGVYSSKQAMILQRSIASDCNSLVTEIISSSEKENDLQKTTLEKLFKLKNSTWNKILGPKDFQNFNDEEYFRWVEFYKNENTQFYNLNPTTIEQKLALIEVINMRLIHSPHYTEKNLTEEAQNLNSKKLLKLQKHMRRFRLDSKLSRIGLEDFAADLMFILKGPPITLLDYFTANKTARMNARVMRMVQEEILLRGLKGMLLRIPEKDSYTSLENAKYMALKFSHLKLYKYLALPYDLPWFEKVRIPDELLEKILIDGLDAHNQELILHLKKQNMIDHYDRFRKIYRPIAFSIGFYFYYNKFNSLRAQHKAEKEEEENLRFLEILKEISDKVQDPSAQVDKNDLEVIKEEQFQRMLKSYRTQFNEAPTPEIIKEMRDKIKLHFSPAL